MAISFKSRRGRLENTGKKLLRRLSEIFPDANQSDSLCVLIRWGKKKKKLGSICIGDEILNS